MRRPEALGEVIAEVIVLDGQPLGVAEYDVADATRDRKGDLDVVVERHVVERVAERTLEAWVDLIELAKTAGDLWAVSADEQPVHLEQARLGGVHEQFDSVLFTEAVSAGVLKWVDAKEIIVVGRADEALKPRENIRRPAPCCLEFGQAPLQEVFVHGRRLVHRNYPPSAVDEAIRPAP